MIKTCFVCCLCIYHAVILCSAVSTAIKNGASGNIINVISFKLKVVLNCKSNKY